MFAYLQMKKRILALFAVAALASAVTGCVETVDGRTQAGVPFVKDSVEGRYERSVQQVVDAAKAVIILNGQLTGNNTVNNSLIGRINQTTVYVHVDAIDD